MANYCDCPQKAAWLLKRFGFCTVTPGLGKKSGIPQVPSLIAPKLVCLGKNSSRLFIHSFFQPVCFRAFYFLRALPTFCRWQRWIIQSILPPSSLLSLNSRIITNTDWGLTVSRHCSKILHIHYFIQFSCYCYPMFWRRNWGQRVRSSQLLKVSVPVSGQTRVLIRTSRSLSPSTLWSSKGDYSGICCCITNYPKIQWLKTTIVIYLFVILWFGQCLVRTAHLCSLLCLLVLECPRWIFNSCV